MRHSQIFHTHLFIHLVGKKAVFVPEFLLNANKYTNVHKRHIYTLTHICILTHTCRYTHKHICIHLTTLKHVHSTLTCLYTHTHTHVHTEVYTDLPSLRRMYGRLLAWHYLFVKHLFLPSILSRFYIAQRSGKGRPQSMGRI